MATSSITVRPSAVQIARAAAAAMPSEVSTRPLLGILGVVIGAGLVTLRDSAKITCTFSSISYNLVE